MQLSSLCVVLGLVAARALDEASEISLLLAPHSSPETHPEAHEDLNSPVMAPVAGALTALLKEEGGKATKANQALIDTMNSILNVTMRGRLFDADGDAQTAIDNAFAVIGTCSPTYYNYSLLATSSLTNPQDQQWIGALPSWWQHYFDSYNECQRFREDILNNVTNCTRHCTNETIEICTDSPDCSNNQCNEPTLRSGSAYRAFLLSEANRIHSLIDGVENRNCTTHANDARTCYNNCLGIVAPLLPGANQSISCCAPRQQVENLQCRSLLTQRRDWLLYSNCYDAAVSHYNGVLSQQETLAVSRKAQMRSILRMLCLVDSFGDNQNTLLPACMNARYLDHADVLAMNVSGHVVPAKRDEFTCNAAELPGSAEWDAIHYANLTAGFQACPEVNCQAACNTTSEHYLSDWNLTLASATTTTTTITLGNVECIHQTDSYGVQWDMHSVHSPTISARPSTDTFSVFVYIQDGLSSATNTPTSTRCGILTSVVTSVNCAHVAPAGGQYLRLEGRFDGQVTSGSATESWCSMTIEGSPATEPTTGGHLTTTR